MKRVLILFVCFLSTQAYSAFPAYSGKNNPLNSIPKPAETEDICRPIMEKDAVKLEIEYAKTQTIQLTATKVRATDVKLLGSGKEFALFAVLVYSPKAIAHWEIMADVNYEERSCKTVSQKRYLLPE